MYAMNPSGSAPPPTGHGQQLPSSAQALLNFISQGHHHTFSPVIGPSIPPACIPTPKDIQIALQELNHCFLSAKPDQALRPPIPPLLRRQTTGNQPTTTTTVSLSNNCPTTTTQLIPPSLQQQQPARKGVWSKMHWTIAAAIARHKLSSGGSTKSPMPFQPHTNHQSSGNKRKYPDRAVIQQQQQINNGPPQGRPTQFPLVPSSNRRFPPLLAAVPTSSVSNGTEMFAGSVTNQQDFSNAVLAAAAALIQQTQVNNGAGPNGNGPFNNFINPSNNTNVLPPSQQPGLILPPQITTMAPPFWANAAFLAAATACSGTAPLKRLSPANSQPKRKRRAQTSSHSPSPASSSSRTINATKSRSNDSSSNSGFASGANGKQQTPSPSSMLAAQSNSANGSNERSPNNNSQ
ncbi:hypothetical protein ACOME3_006073 [Neoechinorhynchus agilis]